MAPDFAFLVANSRSVILLLDFIAEQKIVDAIARGELSNLPGAGRPLELDDDRLVPEDLRMAYRILKNAGFVPPQVECLAEIGELERMLETAPEGQARATALRKLQVLRMRLEQTARGYGGLCRNAVYLEKLLDRLA